MKWLVIKCDNYTKKEALKFINDIRLYSNSNKLTNFKPKDIGIVDFRRPMLAIKREVLREYNYIIIGR